MYHYRQVRRGAVPTERVARRAPGSSSERDAAGRKFCSGCREWLPEARFTPASNTPDRLQTWCSGCATDYMLRRRYGITRRQVDALLAEQGGCGICGVVEVGDGYRNGWHVDHDHACCPGDVSCGRCVRGILCARCNKMIGHAEDRTDLLRAAIDYLSSAS